MLWARSVPCWTSRYSEHARHEGLRGVAKFFSVLSCDTCKHYQLRPPPPPKRFAKTLGANCGACSSTGVAKLTSFSWMWYRSLRPLDARRSTALRRLGPCKKQSARGPHRRQLGTKPRMYPALPFALSTQRPSCSKSREGWAPRWVHPPSTSWLRWRRRCPPGTP